jgi:predicted small lipoprotein YifL
MLFELRRALQDEDDDTVRDDIKRLLGALRRRSEATYGIVTDIDALLRTEQTPAGQQHTTEPLHSYPVATVEAAGAAGGQKGPVDFPPSIGDAPPADSLEPGDGPPAAPPTPPRWRRRRTPLAVAAMVVGVTVIAVAAYLLTRPASPQSPRAATPAPLPPPVAVDALEPMLLSPAEINTAMGATAMTGSEKYSTLGDASAQMADQDCRGIDFPAEKSAYAGSGWTAVRGQQFQEPGDNPAHYVAQEVVLFPAAADAAKFFDASAQRWPACANRQHSYTRPGKPDTVWTVGPISATNGTLSALRIQEGGNGWACQRALTVRNNIAVDMLACSYNPADAAVAIAHQIAARVPTT